MLPILALFMRRMLMGWMFMPGVTPDIMSVFLSSFFIVLPYSLLSGFLLTLACSVFSLKEKEEHKSE